MGRMELSVRSVDKSLIFYAKDFDGVEIPPDLEEAGLNRILGIFAERLKRKWGDDEVAEKRQQADDAFRELLAILVEGLDRLPKGETWTVRFDGEGKPEFLRRDADGDWISEGYSPEADWIRRNSR